MVYRIFVEKKQGLDNEARALANEIRTFLGVNSLEKVRILNRYDVEGLSRELMDRATETVFSEPQLDNVYENLDAGDAAVIAVEYLPGQFDMRASSAAQCIEIMSCEKAPVVKNARIYVLEGKLSKDDLAKIRHHLINPVESREASLEMPKTLVTEYEIPTTVETLDGFTKLDDAGLLAFVKEKGLAMDLDDLRFCRDYFITEKRDPTITEIKMIDTYWSDHCRHTTFLTTLDKVSFEDELLQKTYEQYLETRASLGRTKPINLMDIATIATKYLRANGKLDKLDESEEINACTVHMDVETEDGVEKWLLLFKNETHNHPTEIEPFGGAATCIGGAIRDPLSGRAYVYAAMRVTGAADPLKSMEETLPGKLPQKKIVTTAAAGYSSYGNQIGLATGLVDEIYHDGYAAKRMEIGAVIAAVPAENVRREVPAPGDVVILLGGRTGRDGCGGATGSSKSHNLSSLESCGAEVQKGNAPEERKLQRLFRNPKAQSMIKRCNDFGAGGVSVAVGELADGLSINLDVVPKKYDGLDGTELAISESQERMAVVVAKEDAKAFADLAYAENLEATVIASVTEEKRLVMSWNGKVIVDLSREFLNSNGAQKHANACSAKPESFNRKIKGSFADLYTDLAGDLNVCSKRGLSERFDSTIGAGTVLMPFGGKYQNTPVQAMVNKISVEKKHTDNCSFMAYGYNPFITEKSPYHGAYLAVVESLCKLVAAGAKFEDVYLTFQEYFEKLGNDEKRWGKPLAALLGAFKAQMDFGVASIGGKDSMSGSFEKLDVPPTLVSFAVTTGKTSEVITGDFKARGHKVVWLTPEYDENGLPTAESVMKLFDKVYTLSSKGLVLSAYTPTYGGVAEAIMKMSFGNKLGFKYSDAVSKQDIFGYAYGSFILELAEELDVGTCLGYTSQHFRYTYYTEAVEADKLFEIYENKLEPVFSCNIQQGQDSKVEEFTYVANSYPAPAVACAKPTVLIPVFPGTNCEYDSAKVFADAGADPKIMVINNLTPDSVARSVEAFTEALKQSQIVFVPGGFSGGDEPDGSGKFITAFFRNPAVKEQVTELLENRDGLMAGICNGFQALVKLGLVPYGKIIDTDASCPTLTFNTIGRHQSMLVRTRICSNKSPWLANTRVGDVYTVPISHGEGRFLADEALIRELAANGQIATQYVDLSDRVTTDIRFNPNNSAFAIEGITSPDGRVIGKMGHSERIGNGLYKNVPGKFDMGMFESAVKYFKKI